MRDYSTMMRMVAEVLEDKVEMDIIATINKMGMEVGTIEIRTLMEVDIVACTQEMEMVMDVIV